MKKVSIFYVVSFVLALIFQTSFADISLKYSYDHENWQDATAFAGFSISSGLPMLGIYSNYNQNWSGRIYGELIDGRLASYEDEGVFVTGSISEMVPSGSGYTMSGNSNISSALNNGINFVMGFNNSDEQLHIDHILLYDDSSIFNVPVDTLRVWKAGSPGYDDAYLIADAGSGYVLSQGSSVVFDASNSTVTYWYDTWEPDSEPFSETTNITSGFFKDIYWSINGVNVAYGVNPELSYETLMNGMDLAPGTYDLTMEIDGIEGNEFDITTIQIVPEPVSIISLLGGGVFLVKRNK